MKIEVYGLSDVGMRREKNEDSYIVDNDLNLFMVADGMGGHVGGEMASKMAVRTVEDVFQQILEEQNSSFLTENGIDAEDYAAQIRASILLASRQIYDQAEQDPALRGMGTTAVLLLVRNNRIYVANVGDSRGYLIRNGKIIQLTEDHSLVGEQLRAGVISETAAKGHKLKNIITRSVGFQRDVEIDVIVKVPREGDKYLLCSDGLTNMVDDQEILDVVSESNLKEACHILVDMANTRGGEDNITVILSEFKEVGEIPDENDESTIGIT